MSPFKNVVAHFIGQGIPRGVYPERCEILRFAQNDKRRRGQNDDWIDKCFRGRKLGVNRLQKLRSLITEKSLDALLVSQPENCRYLSGFTGSSGYLLISGSHALLATDFRYTEQAKEETSGFEIIHVKGELSHWLPDLVADLGWHKLGFEADFVSYASHHKLSEAIKAKQLNLELVPTAGLVERLRSIKESEELELIL